MKSPVGLLRDLGFGVLAFCLMALPLAAMAQDSGSEYSVGGLLFGDLYYVPSHHLEEGDGAVGLVLRRGYLTFDADWENEWFGRLRFELNQSGAFETYDFELDFKDLYLGRDFGDHRFIAGLQPTLTFDVIERLWGERYLMRTPMDLQGIASRDTGFSLRGPMGESGKWAYRAMIGSGVDFGNESGDHPSGMVAINYKPSENWMWDFYLDRERLPGNTDRTTVQLFVGYEREGLRWGAHYSHQDRQDDPRVELASTFAVKDLSPTSSLIGRVDYLFEPSPRGNDIDYLPFDPSARATLFLAAWEYRANEHFRLTPNVVYITYDENDEGIRPESDLHLRLTLFLDFE